MASVLHVLSFFFLFLLPLSLVHAQVHFGLPFVSDQVIDLGSDAAETAFLVNITLGGQAFRVQLDTGSSDLWVRTPETPLKIANDSGLLVGVGYGGGSVYGPMQFAELRFGEYSIHSQAFINANKTEDELYDGILGVGFDTITSSSIENATKVAWGNDNTLGNTVLSNIFAQNTSLQPFFDISLQRADNLNPLDKGILTFGAHEPGRESIAQTAVLNNVLPKRWSVFIDGMAINGRNISFNASNLATAPSGKLTAVMDTGTTKGLIPDALVDEIYSNIPGAVSAGNMWQVPCVGAMNISFFIGGVEFPVHPLDLTKPFTVPSDPNNVNSLNITLCIGMYAGVSQLGPSFAQEGIDMILGDAFLKNAYVSYNFGADTGRTQNGTGSYIQAVPTTNRHDAWREFLVSRTLALQQLPFLIDPLLYQIIPDDLFDFDNGTSSTSPAPTQTSTPPMSASQSSTVATTSPVAVGAVSDVDLTSASSHNSAVVSLLDKYGAIVIGLLAGNIAILVILLGIALVACTRGALRSSAGMRNISPNYAPVPFKERAATADEEFIAPLRNYGE